jgi:FkbM family methyltransferase
MLLKTLNIKDHRGVLHVGAHDGAERDWYASQGFSQVLWFEPNPLVFGRLQRNIESYRNNFAFNIGIHDEIKTAQLHIASNEQSSSILEFGTHSTYRPDIKYIGEQEIRMMRLDNFLFLSGRDINDFNFLNIDVQGVELNVIKSLGGLLGKLDYIYTEVNEEELYKGCALIDEIDQYVAQYGFRRKLVYITKHKWGDAFYGRV